MFNLFKKSKITQLPQKTEENALKKGLRSLFALHKSIDDNLFEELETLLIQSDVGVRTTDNIMTNIRLKAKNSQLSDSSALKELIEAELLALLPNDSSLDITHASPYVILVVGVNGAGKTTTIGKLAHYFQKNGKSVLLGAGDTFRAAAIEQLQAWGDRNNIPVVAGHKGGDSAAILYDAYSSAKAKNIDVYIADTSGRLHTQDRLMSELSKIKKVLSKHGKDIPHEVMLVVDGTSGGNAVIQAKEFNKAVEITSIAVTKLDGSAKGGVVFAISDELDIPIRFIGTGEKLSDIEPFNAKEFVSSILV